MKDEIKEIYLSNLDWTKTHDNMGGVMGHIVFKDNMSYEDYQKLFKSIYFVLCDKDYITNLQEELEEEKRIEQADFEIIQNLEEENERLRKDYGRLMQDNAYTLELEQKIDKANDYIKKHTNNFVECLYVEEVEELSNILNGGDDNE